MSILYLKALHIIFITAWFSGLFFWGRMLIYTSEAQSKSQAEQDILIPFFKSSIKRVLWIIVIPSLLLTVTFGTLMMLKLGVYREGWFHIKMLLVLLFLAYHLVLFRKMKQIFSNTYRGKPIMLRLLNEVPFVFLIAIVFTVFLRSFFSGVWAAGVFIGVLVSAALFARFVLKKKG